MLDLLALPYVNKGVYRLEDLPRPHEDEIRRLMDAAHRQALVPQLEGWVKDLSRSMIFFKGYGTNVDSLVDVPAFHEKYRYGQTIGVSVFNKKQSTPKHFGPLRVLYNINDMQDDSAFLRWGRNELLADEQALHLR